MGSLLNFQNAVIGPLESTTIELSNCYENTIVRYYVSKGFGMVLLDNYEQLAVVISRLEVFPWFDRRVPRNLILQKYADKYSVNGCSQLVLVGLISILLGRTLPGLL